MKGITKCKRSQAAQTPSSQSKRLPITPSILRKIKNHWNSQPISPNILMLWAIFLLGLFGFLRSGEFTTPEDSTFDSQCHLTPRNIAIDSHEHPSIMQVFLKPSKTDPFRMGISIFLGHSQSDLCPVGAMLAYLHVHVAVSGIDYRPLFQFADGYPLTRQRLVFHLHNVLTATGVVSERFSGHGLCI